MIRQGGDVEGGNEGGGETRGKGGLAVKDLLRREYIYVSNDKIRSFSIFFSPPSRKRGVCGNLRCKGGPSIFFPLKKRTA